MLVVLILISKSEEAVPLGFDTEAQTDESKEEVYEISTSKQALSTEPTSSLDDLIVIEAKPVTSPPSRPSPHGFAGKKVFIF